MNFFERIVDISPGFLHDDVIETLSLAVPSNVAPPFHRSYFFTRKLLSADLFVKEEELESQFIR